METNELHATNNNDNIEDEDDSDENVEPVETESVYQIRPKLEEKFKPLKAKEIIQNVLFDHLSTKEYVRDEIKMWAQDISNTIREKMKKLEFKKYKYIVNVVIGERNGAGVKIGTRCIWDAEADCYAYDSFTNDTIFCVAAVFAVYSY